MFSKLIPTVPAAVSRSGLSGLLSMTVPVAVAETEIRRRVLEGGTVKQWQAADRHGAPLRIVRLGSMDLGQVYEIPAWYRLGSTITSLPALSAIAALDPEDFPALPGQAAAFEDWALAHGWLTAVTVTDDVVVVTAGTVHSRPLPGNVIDPTLAQSSFTLTWTRRPGGKWALFTRQCRADNRSWVWCTLGRVCRFIAQNPLAFELPAPEVTVREGGDGRLYFDGTLAENLQWVEDHLQEGEGVQEWQTVDREGSPLRIILLEEPWYEAGEGLVVEMPVVPQPA